MYIYIQVSTHQLHNTNCWSENLCLIQGGSMGSSSSTSTMYTHQAYLKIRNLIASCTERRVQ